MATDSRAARLFVAVVLALCSAASAQELNARIDQLVASGKLSHARVGVNIVDLQTGEVLAARNAEEPFIPASNMKLLTSGAALAVLGPDFVFRTELRLDGDRLTIAGAGDPALADPAMLRRMEPPMTVRQMMLTLSGAVAKAGATRVSEIIADDRIFDRQLIHPTWPRNQLNAWYCAQVSGLNFHTNVLSLFPSPGAEGRSPTISLEPDAYWLDVEVRARSIITGQNSVWATREMETNRFTLFGEVRQPATVPVDVTVHEPAMLLAQTLAAALLERGVGVGPAAGTAGQRPHAQTLEAAFAAIRASHAEEGPPAGRTVALVTTHLRDILDRCNGDSQNLYAEALLKRIGHEITREPGSWTNGGSVVRMTIAERLGPERAAATIVADGSGMSRENRISPATMTRWLDSLQGDARIGPAFVASLASPTKGNLRKRYRPDRFRNELNAKSGLLDGVRCLSGYITDPRTGRRIAFSILLNDLRPADTQAALRLHEEVVEMVDGWLAARAEGLAVGG